MEKSFYHISEKPAPNAKRMFSVSMNAAHSLYQGHFPGLAVVPGVLLLQMVHEAAELSTKHRLHLQKAGNVKFLKMLTPAMAQDLELEMLIAEEGDLLKLNVQLKKKEQVYFKATAYYKIR